VSEQSVRQAAQRPQRMSSAMLSSPDESVAFTEYAGDRQSFEPALPVSRFFAQYRLGI
jgi:hypothetical protein